MGPWDPGAWSPGIPGPGALGSRGPEPWEPGARSPGIPGPGDGIPGPGALGSRGLEPWDPGARNPGIPAGARARRKSSEIVKIVKIVPNRTGKFNNWTGPDFNNRKKGNNQTGREVTNRSILTSGPDRPGQEHHCVCKLFFLLFSV